jgi:LysM repeat protein
MRKIFVIYFFISVVLLVASCRSKKPAAFRSGMVNTSVEAYIEAYRDIAISEMKRSGVPASITLAQGMVESNYGRSRLATEANNHFGIKCHNGWTGATIRHDDDHRNECFRRYRNAQESYYDHSDFLRTGSRYSFLFSLSPYDYRGWAHGLKKAGYATNPDYANMLIKKIEEHNLSLYDRGYVADNVPVSPSFEPGTPLQSTAKLQTSPAGDEFVVSRVPRVRENNRIQYIIVKDGDTRESLEEEFGLLKWELPRYNDLETDFILVAGQMLYLQPKREKAEAGKSSYTAIEGDTMYLVSQKFGVKLGSLLNMNKMNGETGLQPGTVIRLR